MQKFTNIYLKRAAHYTNKIDNAMSECHLRELFIILYAKTTSLPSKKTKRRFGRMTFEH